MSAMSGRGEGVVSESSEALSSLELFCADMIRLGPVELLKNRRAERPEGADLLSAEEWEAIFVSKDKDKAFQAMNVYARTDPLFNKSLKKPMTIYLYELAARKDKEIAVLKAQVAGLTCELSGVRNGELLAAKTGAKAAKAESEAAKIEAEAAKKDAEAVRARLEISQGGLITARGARTAAEKKVQDLTAKAGSDAVALAEAQAQIKGLTVMTASLQAQLAGQANELTVLKAAKAKELEGLRAELVKAKSDAAPVAERLRAAETRIEQQGRGLGELNEEFTKSKAELARVTAIVQAKSTEVDGLKAENRSLQARLSADSAQLASVTAEKAALLRSISESQGAVALLSARLAAAEAAAPVASSDMSAKIAQLEEDNRILRNMNAQHCRQIAGFAKSVEKQRQELADLAAERDQMKRNLSTADNWIKFLEENLSQEQLLAAVEKRAAAAKAATVFARVPPDGAGAGAGAGAAGMPGPGRK